MMCVNMQKRKENHKKPITVATLCYPIFFVVMHCNAKEGNEQCEGDLITFALFIHG